MFGLRWHVRFQHLYGVKGKKEYTRVCDLALAEGFSRIVSEGHVILVQGMEFLNKGWNHFPNINDVNSTNVSTARALHQRMVFLGEVCVHGEEFKVDSHILQSVQRAGCDHHLTQHNVTVSVISAIKELQEGQQHAAKSLFDGNEAFTGRMVVKVRQAVNIASHRNMQANQPIFGGRQLGKIQNSLKHIFRENMFREKFRVFFSEKYSE
jgi:hypothetical protein